MDFDYGPGDKELLAQLAAVLKPFAGSDLEARAREGAGESALREVLAALARTRYLGLTLGPGKTESGTAALLAAVELLAGLSPSLCLAVESSVRLFGRAVAEHGTDEQRERWLRPVVEGRKVGALALSEATMNVVNDPLTTRGSAEDGVVVVSGVKGFVVNAPVADLFAVVGLLDDRPAVFLVERGASGLTIGPRFPTSGHAGAAIATLSLDGCRVKREDVVRGPDELVGSLRRWEDLTLVGVSLGLMRTCLDQAKQHARSHKSGGGKPIVKYQEVSFKLAEMLTLYQTSQLLAARSAWLLDSGSDESGAVIDCAKVFCAESAEQVSSAALQILSTSGLVTPNTVERAFLAAKHNQIAGTSTEIARVRIGDDTLKRWS